MPNAKERFLASPHAKRAVELLHDPALIAAMDATIIHMAETSTAHDGQAAASSGLQMKGAIRFRDVLSNIATKQQTPKRTPDSLNE